MYSIFPPLETQNAIVEYLDRKTAQIQEFIAKKERLVKLLEEQLNTFILNSTTRDNPEWDKKKIKYIAKVLRGKFTHRPRNDQSLYDGDYPFIQTGDVARAKKYIDSFTQSLNSKGYKVSAEFPAGTIVMTIAANIGDVAILGFNACFPDSVVGFYPKKEILKDYLYYSLKVKKDDFLETAVVNAQMNLNVERIENIYICIPPISEQENIINKISALEKEVNNLSKKAKLEIEKAKEYQESLITQVVTGQLKV